MRGLKIAVAPAGPANPLEPDCGAAAGATGALSLTITGRTPVK